MRQGFLITLAISLASCSNAAETQNNAGNVTNKEQIIGLDSIEKTKQPVNLQPLAEIGPWPYASRLIGYRGRIWFAASVKYRNHNSSDIWSLDPLTGDKRLERNLFSQDAGEPLVYNDLLYWPHEDALLAGGTGEISATNGEDWASYTIDSALMYHTSELHVYKGNLLAVTGARNAGLQLSPDGGISWSKTYDHVPKGRHIARIRYMTEYKGEYYATLRDEKKQRLVKWNGRNFDGVNSFPKNKPIREIMVHNDALYAIVGKADNREIWKSDGKTSQSLGLRGSFADIASDGQRLWSVTADGRLFSFDGAWEEHLSLKGGTPLSIVIIYGNIYVAGSSKDKKAIIWGTRNTPNIAKIAPAKLKQQYPNASEALDWDMLGNEIDAILSAEETYQGRRNNALSILLIQAVRNGAPDGFFTQRLKADIPDIHVRTFGGDNQTKASDIAIATLINAMAKSGHKNVPVQLLKQPWTAKPNSYEKYLELPLVALKAINDMGQNDAATVKALIDRLSYKDDPKWFTSQVIGTLTAVTGQHFGYDSKAWRRYYENGDAKALVNRASRP